MRARRQSVGLGIALVAAVALIATVQASSVVNGGITLDYPSYPLTGPALLSCEPSQEPTANTITLTGVPDGSGVVVQFVWATPYSGLPYYPSPLSFANVTGGSLSVPVLYPPDTSQWSVWNTDERAIALAVQVRVTTPDGTIVKLHSDQWWVLCAPPQGFQGCTPGYWKQDQHLDSWLATPYAPGNDFDTVFTVMASFDPHTLLDALWLGGGGERALARHAVAALLNATSPDVNYAFTVGEIIAGVQAAYATGHFEAFKDQLDAANNAGCPLN